MRINDELLNLRKNVTQGSVRDIHEHFDTFIKYAEEVDSITEFGVDIGCSTIAFMNADPPPKKMVGIDLNARPHHDFFPTLNIKGLEDMAKEADIDYTFIEGNSIELEIEPTDLLFIDSLHICEHTIQELKLHHGKVKKYILLHDTHYVAPILHAVIDFLSLHGDEWQLKEIYRNCNGLAVLERKIPRKDPIDVKDTLLLSPHCDDEVLGATSFLTPNTVVFYNSEGHAITDREILVAESKKLAEITGVERMVSTLDYNDTLDTIPIVNLINEYESLLHTLQPHTVLVPNPSYNQDHRVVYEAALTALRPHDRLPFVKRVLVYEQPETFGTMRNITSFRPLYFKPVNIEKKFKLLKVYESQLRGHRGAEGVKAIATVRGLQCNKRHAEAFEIVRWVE